VNRYGVTYWDCCGLCERVDWVHLSPSFGVVCFRCGGGE
jgi:hypothetical protein